MLKKKRSGPAVAAVLAGGVKKGAVEKALREGADLLELRVDTFGKRTPGPLTAEIRKLDKLLKGRRLPLILTVRRKSEGGKFRMAERERLEAFRTLIPFADYVDVELLSGAILADVVRYARRHGKKVILSYHNFKKTPGGRTLESIVRRARGAGADLVKIATKAVTREDLKTLAGVLLAHEDLIVIAMGRRGMASRVFFPMLGSRITYGSVTETAAPGQLTVKTLKKELALYYGGNVFKTKRGGSKEWR